MGSKQNYKYIGVQQGDKCFASNELPTMQEGTKSNCNISCDNINSGNCGGFFYNQIYQIPQENPLEMFNNFIQNDIQVEKINSGLNETNICSYSPIDNYMLFFYIIVIIILGYLLFEYLHKK
jgi:hypothetical protein